MLIELPQEREAGRQLWFGIHPRAGGAHEEPHARVDRGREDVGHRQPGMTVQNVS